MPRIYDERKSDGEFILLGTSATIPNRHDIGAVFGEVPFVGSLAYDETTKTMELYHTNVSHSYAWETVCAKSGLIVDKGVNQFDMTGTDFVSDGPVYITGTLHLSLGETGVTPGTYEIPTLTVDANGRVTSITPYSTVVPPHVTSLDMTAIGVGITLDGTNAWNLTLNPLPGGGPFTNAVITVNGEGFVTDIYSGTPIPDVENFTTVTLSSSTLSLPTTPTITIDGTIDIELDTKITLPPGHETETVLHPILTMDQYGFIESITEDSIPSYFLTPEMFGAVGDGVHDDGSALNQMFSWASGSYYNPLMVGKIPVTNCMKLTAGKTYFAGSFLTPSSGRLYGANKTSITGTVRVTGVGNLYFENVVFNGDVSFRGNDDLILSNCRFTSVNFNFEDIQNLVIDNCLINLNAPNASNITNCTNVSIVNNSVDVPNITSSSFPTGGSWYIFQFETCTSLTFTNNYVGNAMIVPNTLCYGLGSYLTTSVDISNNVFLGTFGNVVSCIVNSYSSINISNNFMNCTPPSMDTQCPMSFSFPPIEPTASLQIIGNIVQSAGYTTYVGVSYCPSFIMAWNRPPIDAPYTVAIAQPSTAYEVF